MELEDIYKENYPIVYGYLLSLCGNPDEAEELTAQILHCNDVQRRIEAPVLQLARVHHHGGETR